MRHGTTTSLLLTAFVGMLLVVGCDDSTEPQDRIVEGVNLTQLFAQPTRGEIDAVANQWTSRDVSAQNVEIVVSEGVTVGTTPFTLSIVSHTVAGVKHFGAIMAPDGSPPANLPVLVYSHGSDGGLDVDELIPLLPLLLEDLSDDFVLVAPSFRSEPLVYNGATYLSEGPPSPWDWDVDDALALVNVSLSGIAPSADPERIGIVGFSRGACVALLMAERDPRIDLVVEFFGPTDFFGPFAREVVEEALLGSLRDLPGLDYLNTQFIQPLKNGQLSIEDVRPELVRRSPVWFAEDLPQLQVHHGTADEIVPVGEAQRLDDVMRGLGRSPPAYEAYVYEGGTHNPLSLPGSLERTREFVGRLVAVALAAR